MKTSNANKVISVLMSVAMCPMMVPNAAFAADDDTTSDAPLSTELTPFFGQDEGTDTGASLGAASTASQSEATGKATGRTITLNETHPPQLRLAKRALQQTLQRLAKRPIPRLKTPLLH